MYNVTMNNLTQSIYEEASDEVLTILDEFGFYTDIKFEPLELKKKIAEVIQNKVAIYLPS